MTAIWMHDIMVLDWTMQYANKLYAWGLNLAVALAKPGLGRAIRTKSAHEAFAGRLHAMLVSNFSNGQIAHIAAADANFKRFLYVWSGA